MYLGCICQKAFPNTHYLIRCTVQEVNESTSKVAKVALSALHCLVLPTTIFSDIVHNVKRCCGGPNRFHRSHQV